MAAYADSSDMELRFDARTLKDLVSDTSAPAATLSGNAVLGAALDDATGMIKSAVLVGRIYSDTDLDGLTGESLAYLKRITCEIALSLLIMRRPEKYGKQVEDIRKNQGQLLDMFRSGARVFDVAANLSAGTPTVGGPTAVTYQRLNLIPSRTRNYYPNVQQRLPIGR